MKTLKLKPNDKVMLFIALHVFIVIGVLSLLTLIAFNNYWKYKPSNEFNPPNEVYYYMGGIVALVVLLLRLTINLKSK